MNTEESNKNKKMRFYLLICLSAIISCSAPEQPTIVRCIDDLTVQSAPLFTIKKLASAKDIDGKMVTLKGYFSYNFEDVSLYERKNDFGQLAVWLEFNHELFENDSILHKLSGKKIRVTGRVDLSAKGHLGYYYCTLTNITCVKKE